MNMQVDLQVVEKQASFRRRQIIDLVVQRYLSTYDYFLTTLIVCNQASSNIPSASHPQSSGHTGVQSQASYRGGTDVPKSSHLNLPGRLPSAVETGPDSSNNNPIQQPSASGYSYHQNSFDPSTAHQSASQGPTGVDPTHQFQQEGPEADGQGNIIHQQYTQQHLAPYNLPSDTMNPSGQVVTNPGRSNQHPKMAMSQNGPSGAAIRVVGPPPNAQPASSHTLMNPQLTMSPLQASYVPQMTNSQLGNPMVGHGTVIPPNLPPSRENSGGMSRSVPALQMRRPPPQMPVNNVHTNNTMLRPSMNMGMQTAMPPGVHMIPVHFANGQEGYAPQGMFATHGHAPNV